MLLPTPPEERGPLHDNDQRGIHKQLWIMGQTTFPWGKQREADFFFFFCPWKTRGVTPLSDYVAFKGLKKKQTFLYPQGNSWDAELEEGPFRNFLGACHGNQHSRVFICPKIESSTGSLSWVLKSKVDSFSRRNLKGRKEKLKWIFQILRMKYPTDKTNSHVRAPNAHLPLPGMFCFPFTSLHALKCYLATSSSQVISRRPQFWAGRESYVICFLCSTCLQNT